jgi:hypothetical protein
VSWYASSPCLVPRFRSSPDLSATQCTRAAWQVRRQPPQILIGIVLILFLLVIFGVIAIA